MSADPIIYCLEHLTDYRQFERLCSDLMASIGYTTIEPLGGSNDRGRDAIYTSPSEDESTIFAYSVRSDWKQKLVNEDCKRIKEEGHKLKNVIFVCTQSISATANDSVKKEVKDSYGWDLELFDLERIRVLLNSSCKNLLAKHPSIFCPPWFTNKGGLSVEESKDTLVIDHTSHTHSFATWLSRRLQINGYKVWCHGNAPLCGEDADDTIRSLIENRAIKYLPVLSERSLHDNDFVSRIGYASNFENLTIPCNAEYISGSNLSKKLQQITPAHFESNWLIGLSELTTHLQLNNIKPQISPEQGIQVALRSYLPESVTKPEKETILSNVFRVSIPQSILVCNIEKDTSYIDYENIRHEWAFAKISPTKLLSFTPPPSSVQLQQQRRIPEYSCTDYWEIEGRKTFHLIKELIRRSLDVAMHQSGLAYCKKHSLYYFPQNNSDFKISYIHVDNRKTWINATGKKKHGFGTNATKFHYQISPSFTPSVDGEKNWWVTLRFYIRITDTYGRPLESRYINPRRKKVTKNWWNKEWLCRLIAVMQHISNKNSEISIGESSRKVTVNTSPLSWDCPISIDIDAVNALGDFQIELASNKSIEDEN